MWKTRFATVFALGAFTATAATYISAEPIPSPDIVGAANLAKIESSAIRTSSSGATDCCAIAISCRT